MSNFKDIKTVNGGIDSDSDIRDIVQGDYLLESLNLSAGISIKGTLLNLKGSTQVSYNLPSGNNTCIGAIRDIQRNAIIYFVYNDQGGHSILHYFCGTNTIEAILEPSLTIPFTTDFLNFQKLSKIHSANIINDILLWTDNFNPPRKINIKRAKDFMLQLTPSAINTPYNNLIATGTLEEKLEFIDWIKRPNLYQPTLELLFNPDRKTNFIKNKMIQVRYRYLYDDNEPSVWTTGSEVTLPFNQENVLGIYAVTTANNYIRVTYNSGHPTVKQIEIAFRFDNSGAWQKLDQPIDKYDNDNQELLPSFTNLTFDFYNDRNLIPLPLEQSLKNYDAVPLLSKTMELIDSNRAVLVNNLEGYDNPELDVTLTPVKIQVDMDADRLDTFKYVLDVTNYVLIPYDIGSLKVGDVVFFTANYAGTVNDFTIAHPVTLEDLSSYPFSLQHSLYEEILNSLRGVSPSSVAEVPLYNYLGIDYAGITIDNASMADITVYVTTKKITTFKDGANHKFCFIYHDEANRDGGAIVNDSLQVYNQYLPEYLPNFTVVDNQYAYQTYINATIRHRPPIWAKSYSIGYALNNLKKYTQFLIKGEIVADSNGNYVIDCSYIQDYVSDDVVQTSVDFQFEVGDYIRFIYNADWYCPQYVETQCLGYDSTTKKMTVRQFALSDIYSNMSSPTSEGMLCELFSYKLETENVIYYEFAQNYPIIDAGLPTRSHAGNIRNQNGSLSISAIVKMSHGDGYIYRRYFDNRTKPSMVESENFSDYYQSKNIDISRIQIVTDSEQKRYAQQIRYGGRFFPNTNTNNLLSFDGDSVDTLDTRYGDINRVCTVGYVLKVLQTKKMTSVYINRNMLFNADGTSQLIQTDQVLSNKQISDTDFGCVNPESVCTDDRQMFFFDLNTGSFIQDSANGPYPISNYKFINAMKNKARLINNSQDDIFVYCNVDNLFSTVNVSFVNESDPLSEINDTYIYNTNDNRWKPRQSYIPEYVCSNALVFVSFKNGELYTHNTNDTRNNFYGVQYDSVISLVSNPEPSRIKAFDSIWQRSTKLFSCPTLGDITLPATGNYTEMQSRLLSNLFVAKEGQYYAYFLRNGLTANKGSVAEALQTGDKLRGQAMKVKLTNSDTTELTLYEIIINSTLSDIS